MPNIAAVGSAGLWWERVTRVLAVRETHPPGWDSAALLLVRPLAGPE
jgi:hypothetical protein